MLGMGRYALYVNGSISFMPNQVLIRLPVLFIVLYSRKALDKQGIPTLFYICMIILDIIAGQFASISMYSVRIGMYFSIFYVDILSKCCICISNKFTSKKMIVLMSVCAYVIFYWWFYFVYTNNGYTVPYISRF